MAPVIGYFKITTAELSNIIEKSLLADYLINVSNVNVFLDETRKFVLSYKLLFNDGSSKNMVYGESVILDIISTVLSKSLDSVVANSISLDENNNRMVVFKVLKKNVKCLRKK